MHQKASWAGLICRTDQCLQRQRLPYTCWIKTVKSVRWIRIYETIYGTETSNAPAAIDCERLLRSRLSPHDVWKWSLWVDINRSLSAFTKTPDHSAEISQVRLVKSSYDTACTDTDSSRPIGCGSLGSLYLPSHGNSRQQDRWVVDDVIHDVMRWNSLTSSAAAAERQRLTAPSPPQTTASQPPTWPRYLQLHISDITQNRPTGAD